MDTPEAIQSYIVKWISEEGCAKDLINGFMEGQSD